MCRIKRSHYIAWGPDLYQKSLGSRWYDSQKRNGTQKNHHPQCNTKGQVDNTCPSNLIPAANNECFLEALFLQQKKGPEIICRSHTATIGTVLCFFFVCAELHRVSTNTLQGTMKQQNISLGHSLTFQSWGTFAFERFCVEKRGESWD